MRLCTRVIISCTRRMNRIFTGCPISHVPVAACRSVGSGQEAGQPPTEEKSSLLGVLSGPAVLTGRRGDRQPEAKPVHPALNGGRGLKQRRSGLFWIPGANAG